MRDNREHRLQSFADRFIDRVVLPPMFTSAIDAASMTTDNARARAAGRGVKFGLPDTFVAQGDGLGLTQIIFIEYKRGSALTERQKSVHAAMQAAGISVFTATSIYDVHQALWCAGFRLHGNSGNICDEIEERLAAADRKATGRTRSTPRLGPSRKAKPTARQVARVRAAGALV